MRIGELVGGVALLGVAVLVGIALTDDPTPQRITSDTSPFVFPASTAPSTASTSATSPTTPAATTVSTVATAPTTVEAAVVSTAATTAPPLPTLIPPDQRGGLAVRVLNGGARARAATMMSEVLRGAGFAPAGPADAARNVPATRVIFAPGRELEAATVNDVIRARPENVVPGAPDDSNWAAFGDGLAVLVVLGPA
jgi:hypothetical protein